MKKVAMISLAMLANLSVAYADNVMQLSVQQPLPDGLAKGVYTISLQNVAVNISDTNTPVTNGWAGLVSQLDFVNEQIRDATYNGEHMYNFGTNLYVKLTCKNGASVSYQYDATDVRTKGPVVLQPPANCG